MTGGWGRKGKGKIRGACAWIVIRDKRKARGEGLRLEVGGKRIEAEDARGKTRRQETQSRGSMIR